MTSPNPPACKKATSPKKVDFPTRHALTLRWKLAILEMILFHCSPVPPWWCLETTTGGVGFAADARHRHQPLCESADNNSDHIQSSNASLTRASRAAGRPRQPVSYSLHVPRRIDGPTAPHWPQNPPGIEFNHKVYMRKLNQGHAESLRTREETCVTDRSALVEDLMSATPNPVLST